jgi:hypothetical protein
MTPRSSSPKALTIAFSSFQASQRSLAVAFDRAIEMRYGKPG